MHQPSTQKIATIGLFIILSLFILLHLSIIIGLVPYQMVWGGRLTSYNQMLTFESISLIANVLMLVVVGIYAVFIKWAVSPKIVKVALWVMAALFVLNTLGNFASTNEFEKLVFAPITFLLALFCMRLAVAQPYTVQKFFYPNILKTLLFYCPAALFKFDTQCLYFYRDISCQ